MKTKIAIIGAGNLGVSLAKGLVKSEKFQAKDITLTRRRLDKITYLAEQGFLINNNNKEAVENANIIVIAVLPQKADAVLSEIAPNLNKNKLVISLVTGIKIEHIQKIISSKIPIIRAMPNTAIAIRESMTCIATNTKWKNKVALVKNIFDAVGETIIINEEQMTSATALCACGIAYFLRAIRAASQGGCEIDFHASEALKMAAQTAKGAAGLLITNHSHPEDEIDKVTSPKGCTIAGLNEMEHHGFSSSFIKGITVSANKAKGLHTNNN